MTIVKNKQTKKEGNKLNRQEAGALKSSIMIRR